MGRIFKDGNHYKIISAATGAEKTAFVSNLEGSALANALCEYAIEINLSGWSPEDVCEDLGIIPGHLSAEPEQEPEFVCLMQTKGADYWKHVKTGLARKFYTRKMEREHGNMFSDESEDGMRGRASSGYFTGRVEYSQITDDFLRTDFEKNRHEWREYKEVWNAAFRTNDIVFK